jgi:hypothetical protein
MRLITKTTTRAHIPARMSAWIGQCQQKLSDRLHAAGDERARQHGWEVTASTGRFGFGARSHRDPRFADRRHDSTATAGLDQLVLGAGHHGQLVKVHPGPAQTCGPTSPGGRIPGPARWTDAQAGRSGFAADREAGE